MYSFTYLHSVLCGIYLRDWDVSYIIERGYTTYASFLFTRIEDAFIQSIHLKIVNLPS